MVQSQNTSTREREIKQTLCLTEGSGGHFLREHFTVNQVMECQERIPVTQENMSTETGDTGTISTAPSPGTLTRTRCGVSRGHESSPSNSLPARQAFRSRESSTAPQ